MGILTDALDATLATLLFDERGQIMDTRPTAFVATQKDATRGSETASVITESTSSISPPFSLAGGNQVVAALAVPIFASTGGRLGTLVGLTHCQRVKAIDPRPPNPFLHKRRNVQSLHSSGIFQSPSNADSLESC